MWLVVSNPSSGGGKGAQQRKLVIERLNQGNEEFLELKGSNAIDLKEKLAQLNLSNYKGVIAVGGDGLIHLVIQFLAKSDTPLLIIPSGTGNDIARTLELDIKTPAANLDLARTGAIRNLDLGQVNSRFFLQILSTGFDSLVNERANRMRRFRGRLKYNLAILLVLTTFRPKSYMFRIDGVEFTADAMLIAVANGKSYGGGMLISPNSSFDDGLLDVMILGPVSKLEFIKVFPSVYKGRHIHHPAVKFISGRKIDISADAVAYADGERIGELPSEIRVVPGGLKVWSK